jgi:hypothetical protein
MKATSSDIQVASFRGNSLPTGFWTDFAMSNWAIGKGWEKGWVLWERFMIFLDY